MDHTREGPLDSSSILSRNFVKLPSLKRPGSHERCNNKTPLLTLRFSSSSCLNTVVEDETRHSLYTIKTSGYCTTVTRSDPCEGMIKIADIRWPKNAVLKGKVKKTGGVQVQMRKQRWVDEASFLCPGSSSSSTRKFSIPNYSQSLKWRQIGTAYWCTAPSVKGPIAILESAVESLPLRLQIYETFRDKYDRRQISDHQGVSILLLDYVLVTSLLLISNIGELMQLGREDKSDLTDNHAEFSVPNERTGLSAAGVPMTSMPQWRKIMYGEPIYPKYHAGSNSDQASPVTPTSLDNLPKVKRCDLLCPNKSSINFDSSSDSDSDNDGSFSSPSPNSIPPITPPGVRASLSPLLSETCFNQSLNLDHCQSIDEVVQQHHPILSSPAPPRLYQSPTIDAVVPNPAYPYESHRTSTLAASRSRSTPPEGQLPSLLESLSRNARSPSLPNTLLVQPAPVRRRPLPPLPDSSSVPTVPYERSGQRSSRSTLHDKYGSCGSRGLPLPPTPVPVRQQDIYPLEAAIDAGPAHPSQSLFHSSHAEYTQFTPPFQSYKTSAENDLPPWMGRQSGITNSRGAPSYDVLPPAYSTINFDN